MKHRRIFIAILSVLLLLAAVIVVWRMRPVAARHDDRALLRRVAAILELDPDEVEWTPIGADTSPLSLRQPVRAYSCGDYAVYLELTREDARARPVAPPDALPFPDAKGIDQGRAEERARAVYQQLSPGQEGRDPAAALVSLRPACHSPDGASFFFDFDRYYRDVKLGGVAQINVLADGSILSAYLEAQDWSSEEAEAIARVAITHDIEEVEKLNYRGLKRDRAYTFEDKGKVYWCLEFDMEVETAHGFFPIGYLIELDAVGGELRLLASSLK